MLINEMFESVQGEGLWLGMPSLFIRVAGCNLRCAWCDTPRARSARGGSEQTVSQLVARARASALRHVVITGGEPAVYADELIDLCRRLRRAGKIITVESNATVFVDCHPHLMSLSPKLPAWHQQVIAQYCRRAARTQIKLVVSNAAEAGRAWRRVAGLGLPHENVYIMPRARTRAEHIRAADVLVPWCIQHGARFAVRAQTLLWNNTAGR